MPTQAGPISRRSGQPSKGHKLASAAIDVAARQLGQPIDLLLLWGVEPRQVALYMTACDMMLMTSLIEGSPNVVKEPTLHFHFHLTRFR